MTVDHASRDQLYRSAVEALGREEAETLMAALPPVDWSQVATKDDIARLEAKIEERIEASELRMTAHVGEVLRHQTQWVFGSVVVLALSLVIAAIVG